MYQQVRPKTDEKELSWQPANPRFATWVEKKQSYKRFDFRIRAFSFGSFRHKKGADDRAHRPGLKCRWEQRSLFSVDSSRLMKKRPGSRTSPVLEVGVKLSFSPEMWIISFYDHELGRIKRQGDF